MWPICTYQKGFDCIRNKVTSSNLFDITARKKFRRTSDWFTKNTLENFNIVITSSYTNAKIKVSLSLRLARYLKIKLRTAFLKINQKKVIYTRLSDSFVVIMCYCYHWHHTVTTVRSTFHENTGDILDILTNLQFQFPLNTVRAERAKQC